MKGGDVAGLLIRQARLRRDWSQEGLCRGICAPSYLSKIEQGRAEASDEVRGLLFARLGLSWTEDPAGALHARTEECMEALLSGGGAAFKAAFEPLRAEEERFLGSSCAADYLLLRAFACENEGERRSLDAEFVSFLDQRQLALQRVLEGRYEEAVRLYPAPVLRLWQGAPSARRPARRRFTPCVLRTRWRGSPRTSSWAPPWCGTSCGRITGI